MHFRKMMPTAIVAALMFGAGATAHAATVAPLEGTVLINTGDGFAPINGPVDVPPGALVTVEPGGHAEITYEQGCSFEVLPGSVAQVTEGSPCRGGERMTDSGASGAGSSLNPIVIVGGVVAVGGIAALALSGGGDDGPSSP